MKSNIYQRGPAGGRGALSGEQRLWGARSLVVGAGVSGLSAAVFLAQRGARVELWEGAKEAGGMLSPVSFRGVECDLGSHRIHGEALPVLRKAARGVDWRPRPRRGALVLRQRHIAYPLYMPGFLWGLGLWQTLRFGLGFLTRGASWEKYRAWEQDRARSASSDGGFEGFVRARVGQDAYESFYRPYAEKVWGIPARDLSASVAKKRVSTAEPLAALRQALFLPQSAQKTFLYPRLGMGSLIRCLQEEARALGVTFRYQKSFSPQDFWQKPGWDHVLYGGHISELMEDCPLRHRGLYLLYLSLPLSRLGDQDTFYLPERCYWFGRVSEVQNFSPLLRNKGETTLCVEIPEGSWGTERDFVKDLDEILRQLGHAGILPRGVYPKEARQVFLPKIYPLYERSWWHDWQRTLKEISRFDRLFPIGRQGLFLHCNIDHCVQISLDAVEHISAHGAVHDWLGKAQGYLETRVRD